MGMIAVVGSINMDCLVTAERIPGKGETVIGKSIRHMSGGKGANQAVAIAKLGGEVEMFGCVGQDAFGKTLLDDLEKCGVGISHVHTVAGESSGAAFITIGEEDNSIVIVPGANASVDIAYIQSVEQELLRAEVIVLQHEIPLQTNEYVIELAAKHKKTVILNPAPAKSISSALARQVTYLTPNEHEAALLFGQDMPIETMLRSMPEKLIVTQGEQGVSVCLRSDEVIQIPAVSVSVVDTTGAGDTLNGAFAFMLARGAAVVEALRFANCAASCAIESFGAQDGMPSYELVLKRMNKR